MKKFKVPVNWQMYGEIEMEAENWEQAVDEVMNNADIPNNGYYLDSSLEVNECMVDECEQANVTCIDNLYK